MMLEPYNPKILKGLKVEYENIIYDKKNTNLFRILFILASIIFLIYDAIMPLK